MCDAFVSFYKNNICIKHFITLILQHISTCFLILLCFLKKDWLINMILCLKNDRYIINMRTYTILSTFLLLNQHLAFSMLTFNNKTLEYNYIDFKYSRMTDINPMWEIITKLLTVVISNEKKIRLWYSKP